MRNETFHCPKCKRLVYNRKMKNCGFCGAELPKEFQLTETESKELAKQDADAEALLKIRRQKDKEEEEKERQRARRGLFGGWV